MDFARLNRIAKPNALYVATELGAASAGGDCLLFGGERGSRAGNRNLAVALRQARQRRRDRAAMKG